MEYIVYSISNHTCAGNAETSINTGLKLCSSSITSDWKIEFDFTTQTISAAQQSYIRCRHETSPYPGVGLRSNTANGPTQIQINSSSTTVATGNNKRCTGSITRSGNTITVVFNGTTFSKAFTNHESPLTFGGELENSAAGTWKSGRFSSIVINSIRIIQYASYSVPMEAFMWSRRMAMTYTDKYIVFTDPVVEQICATNWGDGVGITQRQAAQVTSFESLFDDNLDITSFDEMRYFVGIIRGNILGYFVRTYTSFSKASYLQRITFPETTSRIGDRFFTANNSQTEGNSAKSLERIAFINSGVLTFGAYVFQACNALAEVHITNLNNWLHSAFDVMSNPTEKAHHLYLNTEDDLYSTGNEVTSVVFPDDMTSISGYCLIGCTEITSVTIPSSISSIGANAFKDVGNTSAKCTFIIYATTPPTLANSNAFTTNNINKIYVPASSVNAYKTASNWSTFASYIEAIP